MKGCLTFCYWSCCVRSASRAPLDSYRHNNKAKIMSMPLLSCWHRYEDASRHLCAAADTGDMRQLTRLIDNGVDANVRDYDQRTALHIAARRGLLTVVEYLISLKAEINVVDRWARRRLAQVTCWG